VGDGVAKRLPRGCGQVLLLVLGAFAVSVVQPALSAFKHLAGSVEWESLPAMLLVMLAAAFLLCLAFILTHLRPLAENEVSKLATKRRARQIGAHFTFRHSQVGVDPDLKKRMAPNGTSYHLNYPLEAFPSLAASLLKYKKHEWMILAFEKNKQIELVWENKGPDSTQVSLLTDSEFLFSALQRGFDSALIFHNHPSPDPRHFDSLVASEADKRFAAQYAELFNGAGLNFVMFVCERGRFLEFFRSCADEFLPLSDFMAAIDGENGLGELKNLRLHLERVFSTSTASARASLWSFMRVMGKVMAYTVIVVAAVAAVYFAFLWIAVAFLISVVAATAKRRR
jgi:hypothetical protein